MSITYDIFAETNPVFGTFILAKFCQNYEKVSKKPPEFSLMYLALPLAFSDDLEVSFQSTSSITGLLSWIARFPDVRLDLGIRLDASKDIVSSAVKFGLSLKVLSLNFDGTISLGAQKLPTKAVVNLPENSKRAIRRAERLGTWMGKAGSTGTIFSAFGVVP